MLEKNESLHSRKELLVQELAIETLKKDMKYVQS